MTGPKSAAAYRKTLTGIIRANVAAGYEAAALNDLENLIQAVQAEERNEAAARVAALPTANDGQLIGCSREQILNAITGQPPTDPAPMQLPRTTATGRDYLIRFAKAERDAQPVHVYRDPGYPDRPGNGVSRPVLERLLKDDLVRIGGYVALRGKPVRLTDLGRAVLTTITTEV